MNFFENYFCNNKKRPMNKWGHYFEIYDKHFNKFKDKKISLLEIGDMEEKEGNLKVTKALYVESLEIKRVW